MQRQRTDLGSCGLWFDPRGGRFFVCSLALFPDSFFHFSVFFKTMISTPVTLPVWVLSNSSISAPTQVYPATLIWEDPSIVSYTDTSFEVIFDASRIRVRTPADKDSPAPWGEVAWADIRNLVFKDDPRRLASFRGQGHPPAPGVLPEEPTTKKLKVAKPPVAPPAPAKVPSLPAVQTPSSSPTELFRFYHAGTPAICTEKMEKKASIFAEGSPFAEDLIRVSTGFALSQQPSTASSYKSTVARFLEFLLAAKIKDEAFMTPEGSEEVLRTFFLARAGFEPKIATHLKWKQVAPATAKAEVSALIALLRMFGLPHPSYASLMSEFGKAGALRKKLHSNKQPLFASTLERLWALPEMKTDPFNFRNIALCCVTYFFMLRGGESRVLRRNQLELLKEADGEVWKVTLDSSKTDPPILGMAPPGGSWEGYSSNSLLSKVINIYLNKFLGDSYPPELPLFPQVEIVRSPRDENNPFSRRAIGNPSLSWLLRPHPDAKRAGHLTTSDSVNKWLGEVLPKVGVSTHHTMHSLRVGSATEALSLGASLSQIKRMGHWKSLAVLTYAAETLSSIVQTTQQFGSREIHSLGGVVDVKSKVKDFLGLDADGVQ